MGKKIIAIDPGLRNNAIIIGEINGNNEVIIEYAEVVSDNLDFKNIQNEILSLMSIYKIDLILFEKFSSKKDNFDPYQYRGNSDHNLVHEYIVKMKKKFFPFLVHLKNSRRLNIMYSIPFSNDPDGTKLGWKQKLTNKNRPKEEDVRREVIKYIEREKIIFRGVNLKEKCLNNSHITDAIGLLLTYGIDQTLYIDF